MQTRDSAPEGSAEVTTKPSTTTTEVVPPTTADTPVAPCTPGSYQAVLGECGAYISCNTNGVPQKSYCSQGLHWNQDSLSCNWASESNCQDDANAPFVYQNYYQDGTPCTQEGSFAPNPQDCGSFLMCNHQKYIVRPCGGGLHWDNKIKACNSIELAQCEPGAGQPVESNPESDNQ